MNDVLRHGPRTPRVNQPLLFQLLRWQLFRNGAAAVLNTSPVRLVTILLCSLLIWVGVFAGSAIGFIELQSKQIPFAGGIVGILFDLLFFALGIMLLFSTSIILYSSLFSSAETAFLMSTPAAADQVFAYKYQGAIGFSSWAFVLLGSPLLIAYGWVFGVPWYFYVLLLLYFLGFTLLPGSLGALLCLLLVNFFPRQRRQVMILVAGLFVLLLGIWGYQLTLAAGDALNNPDALQRLVGHLRFATGFLVPSHWMAQGLEAAARGALVEALYPLALVWSNGLFLYLVAAWVAARIYRRGYSRVATGGDLRRRYGGLWLDRVATAPLAFLHTQTRLLIVKDFRTFRRDPAQWAQILLFAILLTFYIIVTRRFYQADIGRLYQNGVSLLNLVATAFLLCAYTGRFIFPMLSLEGQKFWILGLLPLQRERLVWGKFAFAATGALAIAEFLVVSSDLLLGMGWQVVGLHALTVLVLALGLSGLSVGLGTCIPNFRQSDPTKIAVGFGGTLNLVIGLGFLVLVIVAMAVPSHLYAAARQDPDWSEKLPWWASAGVGLGILLGALAVVIPLRMGVRALRRMEF
jgi:ABC-2 type transport system permease protein